MQLPPTPPTPTHPHQPPQRTSNLPTIIHTQDELSAVARQVHNVYLSKLLTDSSISPNKAQLSTLHHVYNTFKHGLSTLNFSIPPLLLKNMDAHLQKQINRICNKICEEKRRKQSFKPPPPIGDQYPTISTTPSGATKVDEALATIQLAATQNLYDDDSLETVNNDLNIYNITHSRTLSPDLDIHATFSCAFKCVTEE